MAQEHRGLAGRNPKKDHEEVFKDSCGPAGEPFQYRTGTLFLLLGLRSTYAAVLHCLGSEAALR